MAITKKITNTTAKRFQLNWNIYKDKNDRYPIVKTIEVPAYALNMDCSFADDKDFESFKSQNGFYFSNGNLKVGTETQQSAEKTNETNAEKELKEAEKKINKEIDKITENAKDSVSQINKNNSEVKVEVKTKKA